MNWIDDFVAKLFPLDISAQELESAFLLKYQNIPNRLFKYREANEYSIKNLVDDTVWLADPATFNDPYDCHHFINYDKLSNNFLRLMPQELRDRLPQDKLEEIENSISLAEDPNSAMIDILLRDVAPEKAAIMKAALLGAMSAMFEKMGTDGANRMKDGFKVCSFSERVDSTLMWSHYANYHKGFCIEYDIKSVRPDDYVSRFMYPVIYSEHPFDATPNMLQAGKDGFNNLYLNLAGLIKSMDWGYEKEWRLIFANGVLDKAQPWKMPLPKAVYIGSHISPDDQTRLTDICMSKGISILKMHHSRGAFVMEARPIVA
ncbi:DUF2971 domain-containing protein [Burkholderia sp. MS455]|uniref:DUF2971 domain-containing protein n=1 Tax=Burkholderia sp. MS455 TaxID=2811788 RepID=UPI001958B804|nr:DUF2971 domain-containing protein [Burkholderia sp. MS455]QRR07820.1 DUF2971 domain-containing protein [Burkholderia sp. MS455]